MLHNIIRPLFNFENCVFFCCFFLWLVFKNHLISAGRTRFLKNKNQNKTNKVDHFLTLRRAKIGPLFNFTAYIYIYIYAIYVYVIVYLDVLHLSHQFSANRVHLCAMPAAMGFWWRPPDRFPPLTVGLCCIVCPFPPLKQNGAPCLSRQGNH